MLLDIFLDYFALFRAARCRNINEIYNNYFCRCLRTLMADYLVESVLVRQGI